ncbi:MAG: hypothetical protein K8R18_00815 [Parvibaculum sp.]|uniref:hypothetical protein n=1 Tax=Parvibaculum sp. TaxID=2024848 RepID=UPI0025E5DDA3|nr:hypothetical protein [Parvibaculum sp.]MCE9648138.1 hypothetical protein [Parvibaculum sp.]
MKNAFNLRGAASAVLLCGALVALGGCAGGPNDIGPSQSAPGPMGTDATGSQADVPIQNSQSTPIDRPQ